MLTVFAQPDDDCLACHDDVKFSVEKMGKKLSLYVTAKTLSNSIHKDLTCIKCHEDAAVTKWPHPVGLKQINCGKCHMEPAKQFEAGVHGQAKLLKSLNAPDCKECHGSHDILPKANRQSRTYKMNIPFYAANATVKEYR